MPPTEFFEKPPLSFSIPILLSNSLTLLQILPPSALKMSPGQHNSRAEVEFLKVTLLLAKKSLTIFEKLAR